MKAIPFDFLTEFPLSRTLWNLFDGPLFYGLRKLRMISRLTPFFYSVGFCRISTLFNLAEISLISVSGSGLDFANFPSFCENFFKTLLILALFMDCKNSRLDVKFCEGQIPVFPVIPLLSFFRKNNRLDPLPLANPLSIRERKALLRALRLKKPASQGMAQPRQSLYFTLF